MSTPDPDEPRLADGAPRPAADRDESRPRDEDEAFVEAFRHPARLTGQRLLVARAALWSSIAALLVPPLALLVEAARDAQPGFFLDVGVMLILSGFILGALLGIALALMIVHSRVLERSLLPWIICSQMVPVLALAPIFIVVLGAIGLQGLLPKSIISAYLCFFPIAIGMVKGFTSPDPLQIELMRTWSATPHQVLFKLRWPASLPFLFASLKVAITISLIGAIVAELPTGAEAGIGARLLAGSYYGQTVQLWSALVASAVLSWGLISIISLIERGVNRGMGAR